LTTSSDTVDEGEKTMKVRINQEDLKNLAEMAKERGTERAWMDVALQWIEGAEEEKQRLQAKIVVLETKVKELRDSM
jgi:hypothetical protein